VGPERDWSAARAKVDDEGRCRCEILGHCQGRLQAAHTIGRQYDVVLGPRGSMYVDPLDIVPLCAYHHRLYDQKRLDLLPYTFLKEQAKAVEHVGIEAARGRLTSGLAPGVKVR
jgi:hypothetical protein